MAWCESSICKLGNGEMWTTESHKPLKCRHRKCSVMYCRHCGVHLLLDIDMSPPRKRHKTSNSKDNEALTTLQGVVQGRTFCGLNNLGATCYLNSLLQLYYHLAAFRRVTTLYCTTENTVGGIHGPSRKYQQSHCCIARFVLPNAAERGSSDRHEASD